MDILAVYAASVATITLVWNIARDVFHARRSVRLMLMFGRSVHVSGQPVSAEGPFRTHG